MLKEALKIKKRSGVVAFTPITPIPLEKIKSVLNKNNYDSKNRRKALPGEIPGLKKPHEDSAWFEV